MSLLRFVLRAIDFLLVTFKDEGLDFISVKSQLRITDLSSAMHQFLRVRILLCHTVQALRFPEYF